MRSLICLGCRLQKAAATTTTNPCMCVHVHTSLSVSSVCLSVCSMLNNNCNAFLLLCLLLFMYFFLPYGSRQLPKCCAPHTHMHSLTLTTEALAAVFVESIVRTRAHTRLDSRLSLSRPQLWFLRASFAHSRRLASSFSCLRAVFECATGLRKALLALALFFNIYRCCSCALFAAQRCCTTTTTTCACCCCRCRVCHSKFDSASFLENHFVASQVALFDAI